MAKAKFPGRPSKCHNRKRVLSSTFINYKDFDGFRAAEDAYCRLSVFDFLFPEENEGSLFHGFSPHEIRNAKASLVDVAKKKNSGIDAVNSTVEVDVTQVSDHVHQVAGKKSHHRASGRELNKHRWTSQNLNAFDGSKKIVQPNATVSGKFVLPTRSAHSSRVIKPNKRFLEPSSPDRPAKKSRFNESMVFDGGNDVDKSQLVNANAVGSGSASTTKQDKPHSTVKFVLQKPKLKIKSASFASVEGPFSSQSSHHPLDKLKNLDRPLTKVICGVCGSMWPYKHVKQARKYGIFSCNPCRRFIMKIVKSFETKTIDVLPCSTGTGNCVIRQSTLGSCAQFSSDQTPLNQNLSSRCQGCWLNLCLRSYRLPSEMMKRLSKYLPPEIPDRPTIVSESKKAGLRSSDSHCNAQPAPKISIDKKEAWAEKETVNSKSVKGKIKLPLSGPRVKHVCRSASLVLGLPTIATFDDKGSVHSGSSEVFYEEPLVSPGKPREIVSAADSVRSDHNELEASPSPGCQDYERPVARMLQDLGRDNCDMLDGMENCEREKKFAKLSIDFWESYDPEEVTLSGFPLIGYNNMNVKALCFLCGSAGHEKLVHCCNCCEAYHTFCVPTLKNEMNKKEWWRLDWFCPKCTECRSCFKPGGTQLLCANCQASYHSNCITSGRANVIDGTWMCPSCLHCKSCSSPEVHVFVGNLPLCKLCFKLRKKGNFCPLCQVCYDENDYDTKMMECAECKRWIHAKCEQISDEKYQILSYLPSSIEFVCRHCCKSPPALWTEAVSAQLKVGLLNVIKSLSKNKLVCNLLKASPMKKTCSCKSYFQKPILLKNLASSTESPTKIESEQTVDDKCSDLGLLTPKLTKDDEECLESAKTGLMNLVNGKTIREDSKALPTIYDFTEDVDDLPVTRFDQSKSLNLLSIVGWSGGRSLKVSSKAARSPVNVDSDVDVGCICDKKEGTQLSIMEIKKKVESYHYSSLKDFNSDMFTALSGIHRDSIKVYQNSLKHIFPWFDSNNPCDTSLVEDVPSQVLSDNSAKIVHNKKDESADLKENKSDCSWKELLMHEPNYYYINFNRTDMRTCMFCKGLGEGSPQKEGRLLYCGHNEWVHVNCALWSSEVFEEIDGSLQNVHSAISRSRMIRCFVCGKKGASVGCCARSCPSAYHLSCALDSNCTLLANKEMYCENHSHLRGNQDLHNLNDFVVTRSIYVELDPKRKKEVLHSDVRMAVGSLFIHLIGEIIPEYSDSNDIIIPCNYKCSRLYWSAEEPWKLVRYFIETRLVVPSNAYGAENDINYTIDHSLEITPPPSPLDQDNRRNLEYLANRKEIRTLLNQLVDAVCIREEDNNLAEQQATDLLPPDIEEAIFKDLPHDILDGISMHDIFTKMNFDDFDNESEPLQGNCLPKKLGKEEKSLDSKRKTAMTKSVNFRRFGSYESESKDADHYKWKSSNILQLDGTVDDSSDTDQSMDSADVKTSKNKVLNSPFFKEDEPVKCARCRRTYRSSIGYQRHLPSCDSDFSSESDSGEEEKECLAELSQNSTRSLQVSLELTETFVPLSSTSVDSFSSSDEDSCDSQSQRVNVVVNLYQECPNNETVIQEAQDLPPSPAIIVQPMPQEQVIPQFVPAYSQQPAIQASPDIQYFSSANHNGFPYHSASIAPTVIPTVSPAVVGTIVQSGVDQIVLNAQNASLDMYSPPPNNIYIANPPVLVGMETVVSNTVMSSSQFIPGVPGMLASSYSATTTQVFHTAKPPIDISQNYVVVNTQPQPVVNHVPSNISNVLPDGIQSSPWNNYQMNFQESYKLENGSSSYQTVTRKIVHERKEIDGVKTINSTQETIVIEPVTHSNSVQPQYPCITSVNDNYLNIKQPSVEKMMPPPKVNQPKVVELPHMPSVNKEKPQQAVAPVVIKKVLPREETQTTPRAIEKKETPKVENSPPPCQVLKKEIIDDAPADTNCAASANVAKELFPQEQKDVVENAPDSPERIEQEPVDDEKAPTPPRPVKEKEPENSLPRITFEITSEDGFSFSTSNLRCAWEKVFDRVQNARQQKGLPPLSKNPFSDPDSVLKKALGLGNNSSKYILEQLPGASSCSKYKPMYHRKKLSVFEQELSKKPKENYSGCARTESSSLSKRTYDMFSWLASKHRRPPKLSNCENDLINGNGRRATSSMSLPMAMRFRHLKETSKVTVGVFRSDIHGRGLFCLRDIDSGEMVIEYAGEVIRSSLTDKRERHYTAKGIGCYMFRIDDQFVVDATMKGNAARFINHSCEPNCYSKVVDILGKKHILIFALRKIVQGEELTYDYKFPLEEDKINCHCLSRRCRKYLN